MQTIKDVVAGVLKGLKEKKQAKDSPEFLLKQALHRKELVHTKFRYLHKGVLGITVDSSAWLYQLNLQKPKLLEKLCKKSKDIKDIHFYIGEI
ncbi:MAG: DciA family protein [Candidatus Omnitrophica bacterium]|nr:DciA family protein [Candidatus Omnitrophota bacterium]